MVPVRRRQQANAADGNVANRAVGVGIEFLRFELSPYMLAARLQSEVHFVEREVILQSR